MIFTKPYWSLTSGVIRDPLWTNKNMVRDRAMQHLAFAVAEPLTYEPTDARQDYVPIILRAMAEHRTGLRALSIATGIGKSRLGLLLHRDPAKRSIMTLAEFHRILAALGIDLIGAVIGVEIARAALGVDPSRYRAVVAMLGALFKDLPANLVRALEDVNGMDGTEVRPEWAPVLQQAVIKRLVHEVCAVISRRQTLGDFSIFNS